MDPSSVIDDAEFWLPSEFLTDDDFLFEKENHGGLGFGSSVKPVGGAQENFSGGLIKRMVPSTLEDDISGGFCGNQAFPARNESKAWVTPQSTLCGAGIGCACRNQRSRVSSPAATWDLYCSAAEELGRMNINNNNDRGILEHPRKLSSVAAVKNPDNGSGYYSHQSLQYQKRQALQFQQLKQQQLMKLHRQSLLQSRAGKINGSKNGGPPVPAWPNQLPRRDGSGMRAVFIGDQTGKRGSTGTGVFLPRRVSHNNTSPAATKSTISTVLIPARVAQVLNLNLDESVVHPNLNDVTWGHRSNNGGFTSQMKTEQPVYETLLPPDWAY